MSFEESWSEEIEETLRDWKIRVRVNQHSHHEAGKYYKSLNYCFSVPVMLISSVLGATALFFLGTTIDTTVKVMFGLGGISAAVLTAIQTHMRFGERG